MLLRRRTTAKVQLAIQLHKDSRQRMNEAKNGGKKRCSMGFTCLFFLVRPHQTLDRVIARAARARLTCFQIVICFCRAFLLCAASRGLRVFALVSNDSKRLSLYNRFLLGGYRKSETPLAQKNTEHSSCSARCASPPFVRIAKRLRAKRMCCYLGVVHRHWKAC